MIKPFILQLIDCSVVRDLQIIAGVRKGCSFARSVTNYKFVSVSLHVEQNISTYVAFLRVKYS